MLLAVAKSSANLWLLRTLVDLNRAATWITIGIIVYIALVVLGMPDFCHMVSPAHANDLEEPLSPKEEQATTN